MRALVEVDVPVDRAAVVGGKRPERDLLTQPRTSLAVLLVHGYASSDRVWRPLARRLQAGGVSDIRTFSYDSEDIDLVDLAASVAAEVRHHDEQAAAPPPLHLVGHSLGGLLIRYAVCEFGLSDRVHAVTTLGSPHRGSPAPAAGAQLGRDLRPGSALLRRLDARPLPDGIRWTAFHSDRDEVIPPSHAVLPVPRPRGIGGARPASVRNIALYGVRHLALPAVREVADHLLADAQELAIPGTLPNASRRGR
ncbi:MAG: triacylglycerol lipase [Frankiaceae bacterium]|nr:triacylglycerol lipase [Frankiaceae bacterium]